MRLGAGKAEAFPALYFDTEQFELSGNRNISNPAYLPEAGEKNILTCRNIEWDQFNLIQY